MGLCGKRRRILREFAKLFTASEELDMDEASEAVEHKITEEMKIGLDEAFTEEELLLPSPKCILLNPRDWMVCLLFPIRSSRESLVRMLLMLPLIF